MKASEAQKRASKKWYEKNRAKLALRYKEYESSEAGKKVRAVKDRKSQVNNSDKWYARAAVWRAVKTGWLQKLNCESCGEIEVQAHHHKGYSPEHKFDVVWLCRACHNAEHNIYENPEILKNNGDTK